MARRKKNDFWDDVDEELKASSNGQDAKPAEQEGWSATKSTPVKLIMRFLLMISCLVALASGYIAYQYVSDRYAGGSYSSDFYDSESFATEYNKSVDQVLQLVSAMEADPSVTEEGNEDLLATLVENYMGKDSNFVFLIQDSEHYLLASSGDDAKDRIEASNHYALISNADGETTIKSTIASKLLDKSDWEEVLAGTGKSYIIYSAVDNELTQNDSYYKAEQNFEQMEQYFFYAKFTGIISVILFIIFLVFCIMATGMKRGHDEVCITWYDRIFTEIALIIMVGVTGALVYAEYIIMHKDGNIYQYGSIAMVVVIYIWVAQSYFSIVRRIKAGRLLRYSLIGCIIAGIAHGIGKLPKPLNYIVGAIVLIAINGAAVYGILFYKDLYSVRGIPATYIGAAVVFIIELLSLIVSRGRNDYDVLEDDAQENEAAKNDISNIASDLKNEKTSEPAAEAAAPVAEPVAAPAAEVVPEPVAAPEPAVQDWESMDLGGAIAEAEKNQRDKSQAVSGQNTNPAPEGHETVLLPEEEMEKALKAAGLNAQPEETVIIPTIVPVEKSSRVNKVDVPAAEPVVPAADEKVNFVQLNKDVRRKFKASLKKQGMIITVRAPEKPVVVDMDPANLTSIITDVFSQVEKFSKPDTKTYAEVYLQGGKVVYLVKIAVSDEAQAMAREAVSGRYFETARKIIADNKDKFIVSYEKGILKIGMMMNEAN